MLIWSGQHFRAQPKHRCSYLRAAILHSRQASSNDGIYFERSLGNKETSINRNANAVGKVAYDACLQHAIKLKLYCETKKLTYLISTNLRCRYEVYMLSKQFTSDRSRAREAFFSSLYSLQKTIIVFNKSFVALATLLNEKSFYIVLTAKGVSREALSASCFSFWLKTEPSYLWVIRKMRLNSY